MAINILDEMRNDFLVYANEVNNNRAFPDVRDGLKPAQRAALWEMYVKGYFSNKPHVKCAKVSGGTIATWHPHGDQGVYDTMVRMSQPWVNNLSEIDWHGANGSQQGGPEAASSRYTECRLSPLSEEGFFKNIKKETVDMIPNFSEDEEWPRVFPALFPRLAINGSQGIGFCFAQEWEPMNLIEFTNKVKKFISSGKVDCSDIYPDYPSGGIIINKKEIKSLYETGEGTVILRAKTEIDGNMIKITELPFQTYAEPLIQKIKELVNAEEISGIEDVCNKSGDNGLLIEVECSDSPVQVLNKLYKLTDLQIQLKANMMAVKDSKPELYSLKDYIKTYVEFNLECIRREYTFDLNKATAELEIVVGLIKAVGIIDKVISLIRSAEDTADAKAKLQEKFKFTQSQAQAIVDMRLGKLAHTDIAELEEKKKNLEQVIADCQEVLGSEKKQQNVLISRLSSLTGKYGVPRKTAVIDVDIVKEKAEAKPKKSQEASMITLTASGAINRVKLTEYKEQGKVKNEGDVITHAIKIMPKTSFIMLSETGKIYKTQARKISLGSNKSSGISSADLVGEKVIAVYAGDEEKYLFFISEAGQVKKITTENAFACRNGKDIMGLEDDKLLASVLLTEDNEITLTLNNGKTKTIDTTDFRAKGKGAGGQRGVKLKEGQKVISVLYK